MSSEGSLTIVLPAYNEATRIAPALDELFAWLDGPAAPSSPVDVLVVDDGSDDGTAELVESRAEASVERLHVLRVPHGGKGAAVRAGMLAATGATIIFAHPQRPAPFPKCCSPSAAEGIGDADSVEHVRQSLSELNERLRHESARLLVMFFHHGIGFAFRRRYVFLFGVRVLRPKD